MILSMGFYQLSRLHYCFSNSQIHSDKGYPKWLFNIMYTIGIILAINYIASIEFVKNGHIFQTKCGINDKYEFFYQPLDLITTNISSLYYFGVGLCFSIWDLFTLYLYISKIKTFRVYQHKNPSVYKRIKSILQKVFILTVFYQIVGVCSILIDAMIEPKGLLYSLIYAVSIYSIPLAIGISMWLMMDHNVNKYRKFLMFVQYLKLNYLCCKWKYFVLEQLEYLNKDIQGMVKEMKNDRNDDETRNQTVNVDRVEMPDVSVETRTEVGV